MDTYTSRTQKEGQLRNFELLSNEDINIDIGDENVHQIDINRMINK